MSDTVKEMPWVMGRGRRPRMVLLILAFLSLAAVAEEHEATQIGDEQKYTVTQSTYQELRKAREAMDKERHTEALAILQELLPKVAGNAHEAALAQQSMAYAYLGQKRYPAAIDAIEAALARRALPRDVTHALRYNLAQSYIQIGDYRKGLASLQGWLTDEKNPSSDVYYLGAVCHYHLRQYEAALTHIKQAIAKVKEPREDWYLFMLSLYFESRRYADAVPLLNNLIAEHPRKAEYWRYLTDVYLISQRDGEALATLKLAYAQDLLEEGDLIRLAQLYLNRNIPYSASRLLDKEIRRGRIARTEQNLELLGNSWVMARERKRAIGALQEAAARVRHGKIDLNIARMQMSLENWVGAARSFATALDKGGIKDPDEAQFLLGIACYHEGDKKCAASALRVASKSRRFRRQAQGWLERIQDDGDLASAKLGGRRTCQLSVAHLFATHRSGVRRTAPSSKLTVAPEAAVPNVPLQPRGVLCG
ncbi:MAG: tetratricopeptide repeat protein [Gammaproteobacteria bacterium]